MNKIIVSIILALVLILGINKITDIIYHVEKPEKSAYQTASISSSSSNNTNIESSNKAESENIMTLLASASIADGKKIFAKCSACHSIAKNAGNKIGPALWGVIGRQAGTLNDYKYSKTMAAHGKVWSFEEMDNFLLKPKDWIKGTKMAFMGLKKREDRAAVILYMNENSDNPLPVQ